MSSKSQMEAEITIEGVQVVVYHGGCYCRLDLETGADGIKWFIWGKIYYVFAVNNRPGEQSPVLCYNTEQYH